jgi:hypothetical protein
MESEGSLHELLHSLVREAEKLAGVTNAEPEPSDQHPRCLRCGGLDLGALLLGPSARSLVLPKRRSNLGGKPDLLVELHGICVVDPQRKSFAQATPGLAERPPVRMTASYSRNACEPGSALVSLEHSSITT